MGKVNNPDFFKKNSYSHDVKPERVQTADKKTCPSEKPDNAAVKKTVPLKKTAPISVSGELIDILKNAISELNADNQKALAKKIDNIYKDAVRDRFSISVVGEFSRGKSTFINSFMGKDFLPVGDLPTTAILTRIRFNPREMLVVFDKNGKKQKTLPLSQNSWENLTADNFSGNDPEGTVLAGVNVPWLDKYNAEIIDTPGAGDLEEKRAQLIGDALLSSDGAIITISATQALSMSEKLFIEQRLLSRKTPFLMMIVTKLDEIPLEQREDVVEYICEKLNLWKMDIPVYIPYEIETSTGRYNNIMGMDKVRNEIISWINAPERVQLTENWIISRTLSLLEESISSLKEQAIFLNADDEKLDSLVKEKLQKLSEAEVVWGDLKLKMLERSNSCYTMMLKKIEDYKVSVTERLQYEASHSNNPQKWWNDDYPYRLKIELTNMSVGVENAVSRRISEDAGWFNAALDKSFKAHVLFEKDTISDKELFGNFSTDGNIKFENLEKQRAAVRIGTTVLSIAGYAICASAGFLPLIATMGIGTGAGLISEKVFKNKIEKQQNDIKNAIAKNIPEIIDEAMGESERRLKAVYDDMIKSAAEKEESWLIAQKEVIEKSAHTPKNAEQQRMLDNRLKRLTEISEQLKNL